MQVPTKKTPVARSIDLGLYARAMLAKFPQNAVLTKLGTKMGTAIHALDSAQHAYALAVRALIVPRVNVRFADYSSDAAVRATMRAAETADGMKNGKIVSAVFPDGVTPIVRPVGATQVKEMRDLEGRLEAVTSFWPGAAAEKAKIADQRAKYEAALEERRDGMQAASDLRAKRDAAREDFLDVYSVTSSRVKAEFPRNRPMQDLFFDEIDAGADDAGDDETDTPDALAGGGAPAAPAAPPAPQGAAPA